MASIDCSGAEIAVFDTCGMTVCCTMNSDDILFVETTFDDEVIAASQVDGITCQFANIMKIMNSGVNPQDMARLEK